MTWWMILLTVLIVLWLVLQLRLKAKVRYGPDETFAELFVGPVSVKRFPGEKQKSTVVKKKKQEEKTEGRTDRHNDEGPGTLSRLMQLLPVVGETVGALRRRIRIDDICVSVVWASEQDPAAAAIGYGRANAAIGMIWPVLDHNFKVKKCQFHTDVDYNAKTPMTLIRATATLTLGQILSLVIRYGLKLLVTWNRSGRTVV